MTIYERAMEFIADGDAVGLGSGRASAEFIKLLGARVKSGLHVRCVATSRSSDQLAASVGIPLVPLEEAMPLSLAVDGADEVAPNLDLIKGLGRALVREKIVASAARKVVILVGPGKEVPVLGAKGKLPVEVVPFALPLARRRLLDLGCVPVPDEQDGRLFVSDNGNHIIDCGIQPLHDPKAMETTIRAIPGVVGTGLFLGMAHVVLFGDESFNLLKEKQRTTDP